MASHVAWVSLPYGSLRVVSSYMAVFPQSKGPKSRVEAASPHLCDPLRSHVTLLLPHSVGQGSHIGSPSSKERGLRPDHSTGAVLRICGRVKTTTSWFRVGKQRLRDGGGGGGGRGGGRRQALSSYSTPGTVVSASCVFTQDPHTYPVR